MRGFWGEASPPVRSEGSTGRSASVRAVITVAAAAAALLLAAVAVPTAAAAAPIGAVPTGTETPAAAPSAAASSDPTPTPPASPASPVAVALDPLPTHLVTVLPLPVAGSAAPGDRVHVSGGAATTAANRCDTVAGSDGRWSCALTSLPDGPGVVVRAASDAGGTDATGRVDVLSPPTIASDGAALVTSGGVHGTAYPGATVTVRADNGSTCSFPADSSGVWGCVLGSPVPSGRHTITASQVASFSTERSRSTAPVGITVDTTAPPAPTIRTPTAGTMAPGRITLTGSGEAGGTVTVYASDARTSAVVCTAVVAGGSWSCAGTIADGDYLISALQRDAAGNVSAGSNSLRLSVSSPAPAPPAGSAQPAPASPHATAAPVAPAAPPAAAPASPPPAGASPAPAPLTPDWMRTPFSTASAPVVTADAIPGWMRSVLLALAAVLLLALPARLLTRTMARGSADGPRRAAWTIFGRNRTTAERPHPEAAEAAGARRSPWLIPAGLAAAAALVTLSSPMPDAGAYLPVLLGILVAVAAVNAIWVGIARWLAPHLGAGHAELIFRPALLIVVAAAAIGSRIFDLQPALVFALVVGVRLTVRIGRVPRGRIAAAQLAALAAVGVSAWSAIAVLPAPAGVVSVFLTEAVRSVALLALGSAAVALLPIGGLAGRAVFQWSRVLWLGLGLVVYTLLFALLLPVASLVRTGQSTLVLVIGALGFAAVSVCLWLWERYVEPAR